MVLSELLKELRCIVKVHPEAKNAEVWASSHAENALFDVHYIGYDTKRKPARIKLED